MEGCKFFRERNAESVRSEYELIVPTREELEVELKNKLIEKLDMIDVIFDEQKRAEYLKKKEGATKVELQEAESLFRK